MCLIALSVFVVDVSDLGLAVAFLLVSILMIGASFHTPVYWRCVLVPRLALRS